MIPSWTRLYAESPDKLTFDLRPSTVLAAVLAAAYGGAVVIALLLPIPLFVRIALVALIAVGLHRGLSRHALRRAGDAVVAFSLSEDDACAVRRQGAAEWQDGRLMDRWVHPWLTILVVRCNGRRRPCSIVITPDAVSAEAFRRLRVRLRLQTGAG